MQLYRQIFNCADRGNTGRNTGNHQLLLHAYNLLLTLIYRLESIVNQFDIF